MGFRVKSAAVGAVAGVILATAACGSSGTAGGSAAAGGGAKSTSAPPTGSTSGAPSSAAAGGSALTSDQISALLLTDKDNPGYTFDASQDSTSTTDTQDQVTAGGSACQTFVDAQDGLSTKYGTTTEVDRQLTKATQHHVIQDSVLAFPSPDKAAAMVADANGALQSCKSLAVPIDGSPSSMTLAVIPQLTHGGQLAYINYVTVEGKTVLMATELVNTGQAVSVVALDSPVTSDKATLEQMGATLAHLSDLQVGRLKKAQGLS